MDSSLDKLLQEGKLRRLADALIVSHLRGHHHHQAAASVAAATMTPLNSGNDLPGRLMELIAKGLAAEEGSRGLLSTSPSALAACGAVDFSVREKKGAPKVFPKYDTRHISEHKNIARCAKFSPDGSFVATGSADASIKLFEVSKIKQTMLPELHDGSARAVIRTFYDHSQTVNDLDFNPQNNILISGSKDQTIRFFDFSKTNARRAVRVLQDTHEVRSVSFHPSGEYLLAGTDHPIPHLYDVYTFQCFISSDTRDLGSNAVINQVRYSSNGALYVTASKDGAVRIWDGLTAQCVRTIAQAHRSTEATSARFTKDGRYILSCGKDSAVKLWEVASGRMVKQYLGAAHTQLLFQAVFNETEEFVLSVDEIKNEVVVWDAISSERMVRWPSNHVGAPRWLEHSPIEAAFITCGSDKSIKFWKEV
ncbi:transducin/WD40 repeat-like superfamily protein [Wolffia australiana]